MHMQTDKNVSFLNETMEGLQAPAATAGGWLLVKYHYSEGNASPSNPHDQISHQVCVSVNLSVC